MHQTKIDGDDIAVADDVTNFRNTLTFFRHAILNEIQAKKTAIKMDTLSRLTRLYNLRHVCDHVHLIESMKTCNKFD